MRQFLEIVLSSFRMAMIELWKNKLRTFLSLFGVTIGIFCIIGVLATVNSLQTNIQTQLQALGNNTVYIDKWEWAGGPDYPWWKYVTRPEPKIQEVEQIKGRTRTAANTAFFISQSTEVELGDNVLNNVTLYGVSEEYPAIQTLEINKGRLLSPSEFTRGSAAVVMGYVVAENLFGEADRAVGREVVIEGRKSRIVGIVKKQGSSLVGGWQFDQSVILPYKYARVLIGNRGGNPIIMVKAREGVSSVMLKNELKGVMRSIRRLSPAQDDNFSLNDINELGAQLGDTFDSINLGGWAIGALAFIVGIFGVANIMFVTVKERTSQIGLKKALGAKSRVILMEFLLESAFLCIIGGVIGLLLVFALTSIVTAVTDFPLFLSGSIIFTAIMICIVAGILAGIIPAFKAARLNPVVAIRST